MRPRIGKRAPAPRPNRGGWMLVEIVVSVAILGMVLGGLGLAQSTTRTYNAIQLARQHCTAAGEAQLDRLAAHGKALEAARVEGLWPGVQTQVVVADGAGEWKGLKLVTVRATAHVQGRPVSVELARYYDRALEVQP